MGTVAAFDAEWLSNTQFATISTSNNVERVSLYSREGVPQGGSYVFADRQFAGSLVKLENGNLLVSYKARNQFGDQVGKGVILSSSLQTVVAPFDLSAGVSASTATHATLLDKPIEALRGGGFVALQGEGFSVYSGTGTLIRVGAPLAGDHNAVSALADGGFVVTAERSGAPNDPESYGIVGRIFDADGTARTSEFLVNTTVSGEQSYADVEMLSDQTFLVAWGPSRLQGQLFHSSGRKVGQEFELGTSTAGADIIRFSDSSFALHGSRETSFWTTGRITYGTAAAEDLIGAADTHALLGFGGDDRYFAHEASVVVQEAAGEGFDWVLASTDYTLLAGQAIERLSTSLHTGNSAINLTGNALAQLVHGNAGANRLDGGGGGDTLVGLGGDDSYFVRDGRDVVVEEVGGGFDHVLAGASFVLTDGQQVERLSTTLHVGTDAINLTGNAFGQLIHGNSGSNSLDGGGGGDTIVGLGGDDLYFVRSASDVVVEASGEGFDHVLSSVSYRLTTGQAVERLSTTLHAGSDAIDLTGNGLVQLIHGNDGRNVLDGAGGGDTLVGLAGDDSYFVRDARDAVVEALSGGFDHVLASVSYRLTAGQEVERLSTDFHAGTAAIDLTGNLLSQLIHGNAGSNVLDGGGGADTLIGLGGDDRYLVRSALDLVIEGSGGGSDHVLAASDYRLSADTEIEILSTDWHAGATAVDLTGNALQQAIYGNEGDNVLAGGGGKDSLIGRGGADRFVFDQVLNASATSNWDALTGTANVSRILDFDVSDRIQLDSDVFGFTPGAIPVGSFAYGIQATEASHRLLYDQATQAVLFDRDGAGGESALLVAYIANPFNLDGSYFQVI